jgi:hypothetical protein
MGSGGHSQDASGPSARPGDVRTETRPHTVTVRARPRRTLTAADRRVRGGDDAIISAPHQLTVDGAAGNNARGVGGDGRGENGDVHHDGGAGDDCANGAHSDGLGLDINDAQGVDARLIGGGLEAPSGNGLRCGPQESRRWARRRACQSRCLGRNSPECSCLTPRMRRYRRGNRWRTALRLK